MVHLPYLIGVVKVHLLRRMRSVLNFQNVEESQPEIEGCP